MYKNLVYLLQCWNTNLESVTIPEECPICLNPILKPMKTVCSHYFCSTCLNVWITDHTTCPLCRQNLESKKKR